MVTSNKPLSAQMSSSQTKDYLRDFKKFVEDLSSAPKKKSKDLLVSAGVTTTKGNLKKPYKP